VSPGLGGGNSAFLIGGFMLKSIQEEKFKAWVYDLFKYAPAHLCPKELVIPDAEFNLIYMYGSYNSFQGPYGPIKLWKASEYGLEQQYKSKLDSLQERLDRLEGKV